MLNVFTRRRAAFTLIEIMIVVAITGILISIAVPAWLRARDSANARACQENLTKIEGVKEVYALERNVGNGALVQLTDLFDAGGGRTGYIRTEPKCPSGGEYTAHEIAKPPTCSYNGQEVFSEPQFLHRLP